MTFMVSDTKYYNNQWWEHRDSFCACPVDTVSWVYKVSLFIQNMFEFIVDKSFIWVIWNNFSWYEVIEEQILYEFRPVTFSPADVTNYGDILILDL